MQNSRFCFVENAKRQKLLQEPEYQTLLAWYDYTEQCLDVSLDLIGTYCYKCAYFSQSFYPGIPIRTGSTRVSNFII